MREFEGIRPLVGILWERVVPFSDEVMPWVIGIAQQGWPITFVGYQRTDVARNMMAWALMDNEIEATHLVMLDLDHRHPLGIVAQLCASIAEDREREAVFGVGYRRSKPYEPMAFVQTEDGQSFRVVTDWPQDAVLEVDRAGTSCCIIARSVFERVPEPWFAYSYEHVAARHLPSEDIWFCRQCREAGVRLWLDTRITTVHLSTAFVDRSVFDDYRELLRLQAAQLEG